MEHCIIVGLFELYKAAPGYYDVTGVLFGAMSIKKGPRRDPCNIAQNQSQFYRLVTSFTFFLVRSVAFSLSSTWLHLVTLACESLIKALSASTLDPCLPSMR